MKQIVNLILQEAKKEPHPDKVAGLYAVLTKVNMEVGKHMEAMRNNERDYN